MIYKGFIMTMRYDKTAKKKATTLSINSDLLAKVKELDINISAVLQETLEQKLIEEKEKRWKIENKKAIENYNKYVQKHGVFGEEFRIW
jgi:antitoxin CcdA